MSQHEFQPVNALDVPVRAKASNYPEPFASRMAGRTKRQLGDFFGIAGFGVNLSTLCAGAQSSLLHCHSHQEEFVYILSGTPTLRTGTEEYLLQPGMCVGFVPGGPAHQFVNNSGEDVTYLEIGDRNPADSGAYPEDDLVAVRADGGWHFTRKDGTPY